MNKIVKAGMTALLLTGVLAIPVETTQAAVTHCRSVTSHGVTKQTCTTHRTHRTHCKVYWRHGVKHRRCYHRR